MALPHIPAWLNRGDIRGASGATLVERNWQQDGFRDADQSGVEARMVELAHGLGWLTVAEEQGEFMRALALRMRRNAVGSAEVEQVCGRDGDRAIDPALLQLPLAAARPGNVAHAAVLACLGSSDGRDDVLRALTSASDDDVAIAQVYLGHRPITDVAELRIVASGIARMAPSEAQVRALDALAHQRVADPETLNELTRLFPLARSADVQRAIAGVLIRSDYQMLARADLARALREHRVKSSGSDDVIDALLRRLQAAP